jgi:CO dehydrogenase/acetyl-CoA synthase epsilon subunit
LKSYPDQDVATNTEVVVDGYDVVDAGDYPSESRLKSGGENAYDVVMLTGSSKFTAPESLEILAENQNIQHTTRITLSFQS